MKKDKEFNQSELRHHMEWRDSKWFTSSQDNILSKIGESSVRRSGRPRKIGVKIPVSGNLNRKDDSLPRSPQVEVMETEALVPDQQVMIDEEKLANSLSDSKNREVSNMRRISRRLHKEKGAIKSLGKQENRPLKRGREMIGVQGFIGVSEGRTMEANHIMSVEKDASELPSNEFENKRLPERIEIRSPVNDSSRPSREGMTEQSMANGEKQRQGVVLDKDSEKLPESGMQASALATEPSEPQSLPFVKNHSFWKIIESMEVFRKLPQKPHFQPLEQFKDSLYREGLAIGHMVTFANLVERSSKLQFNDPTTIIEGVMETVAVLERHGFDVYFIQDCVNKFLEAKDKEEKLVDKANNLKKQILERDNEKTRIEEEIREIKEHTRKLQEKLSHAESAKDNVYDAVASLHAQLKLTEESIENLRLDF